MGYTVHVFNQQPLGSFTASEVLAAVTESNFHTLCEQYGLDPALIEPALTHLQVLMAPGSAGSYFALRYQPLHKPPVLLHRQLVLDLNDAAIQTALLSVPMSNRRALPLTKEVVTVALEPSQLEDLGLLFGYELARWAAFRGRGFIWALDGCWYRLNAHKAFLPLEPA